MHPGELVAGVDTHKDAHSIALLNAVGALVHELTIPATPAGYHAALDAVAQLGPRTSVVWGIEGSRSYGRAFAELLLGAGATVYEVPGALTKRHRQHASRRGKSDRLDACAVAEVVLRERDRLAPLAPPSLESDAQEAVRLLYDRRDRLVRQRTEALNRLRAAALRVEMGELPRDLTTASALEQLRARVAALHGRGPRGELPSSREIVLEELSDLLEEVRRLGGKLSALEQQLRPFVERWAAPLLALHGVSTVVAAGLVGHAGPLRQCRSAHAFAMRAGAAPVPCSSGRSAALRLNLGGDRQLNRCLHVIALAQVRARHHAGRLYYERKRREGKTHRAALRSLKRQLATVVYYRLQATPLAPQPAAPACAAA
jgi:transposase